MVALPANPGRRAHAALHPHPALLALGWDGPKRWDGYRTLRYATLDPEERAALRATLQQQHALGASALQAMVEAKTQHIDRESHLRRAISKPGRVAYWLDHPRPVSYTHALPMEACVIR